MKLDPKPCPRCGRTAVQETEDSIWRRCELGHIEPPAAFEPQPAYGPPPREPSTYETAWKVWQQYRESLRYELPTMMAGEFIEFIDKVFDAWEQDSDLVEQEFG